MARRIQVDVWTKDGRHEQSTKSREDADFYNNLPSRTSGSSSGSR